ncbi:PREDICTED: glutamic acid-rich protein [Tarenaya hassleriana]|uniref:glutamic acid-rich protein n=1 Tax=Tarenaya hassleriana TaxID=28532 RepID=UPI00053CA960|nr:PREDICTED: glutamic acid-rich protein [Tarenaya hassleriana]XP_010528141.1 PREDICTED: glutamic acid-rich protein [Tarenaya hassleriana]
MAEVENQQESPLPVKRKPDLYYQDQDNVANKAHKLQPSNSPASVSKDGENGGSLDFEKEKGEIETEIVISPEKAAGSASERDEIGGDLGADEEKEEADDEEEEARREAEADRKGKGIMRDDREKGKLIEDDDSDEDEEDDGNGDSDLSDDPLAEVDLDNILPSRTRRRAMQPGFYIPELIASHDDDDDDDDDEVEEDDEDEDGSDA